MLSHDYEPQALEGRLLAEVLPTEAFERLAPAYRAALSGETRSFDLDSSDGRSTYWVQMGPLRDVGGHVIGGMAISRDISDRRHAERKLQEHALELERSNAELEQFAYVASHDLSEPLRMISSYLQLLRRRYHGELDSDADEFIDFAVDGAARMRDLIDGLLTFSRAGRGDQPFEPVDLQELAERAADGVAAPGGAAPRIAVGPLPTVPGDAQGLGQLFQNLIGNAVKFVPADRVAEVGVDAEREGDLWRFTVTDNGIGLEPAYAERIFRMFQRLHTARRLSGHRHRPGDRQEGRRAARRHDLGRAARRRRQPLQLHAPGRDGRTVSGRSILLVEDNAGDVRLTREALREADVAVELVAVPDGEEALAYLRNEGIHADAVPPDLILLDLNLPKKNGLEVLEEIKGDPELRRTPVIMLTTSSSARDVTACYDRGVNCFVVKPLDLDDFTGLVQAINRFWFEVAVLPPR